MGGSVSERQEYEQFHILSERRSRLGATRNGSVSERQEYEQFHILSGRRSRLGATRNGCVPENDQYGQFPYSPAGNKSYLITNA